MAGDYGRERAMIAARQVAFGKAAGKGLSAKDYVQDGLVAMWDGIENAGWGEHDPYATVWKDLVGGADININFSPLPKSILTWADNSLVYTDTYANSPTPTGTILAAVSSDKLTEFFNGGFQTAETVFKATNTNNYRAYIPLSWLDFRHGYAVGNLYFASGSSTWLSIKTSQDTIYSDCITRDAFYRNGVKVLSANLTPKNLGISVGDSRIIAIRGNFDSESKSFYCVRVYTRALSAEEIAHNYEIDKARFGL
jgi:hypothetical protein